MQVWTPSDAALASATTNSKHPLVLKAHTLNIETPGMQLFAHPSTRVVAWTLWLKRHGVQKKGNPGASKALDQTTLNPKPA